MIERSRDLPITPALVRGAMAEFARDVLPELQKLEDAYAKGGAIRSRARKKGLPNNRLAHAYPRYITTMASGYLIGKPVKYTAKEERQQTALKVLLEAYDRCDMASVDSELGRDASKFGRSVCLCYASDEEHPMPRAATLEPTRAFVVYDDTVEHRPYFGVTWRAVLDEAGEQKGLAAEIYTESDCQEYRGKDIAALAPAGEASTHAFGGVPMVEFWNSDDEVGDYAPVLDQIEAYNAVQSDRVNDKQQFSDAILLLTGCTLQNDDPNDKRSPGQKLMEEKTLALPDSDAKAEWLTKESHEEGNEILRESLNNDIHKLSMVPDLTDEHFASNASGVAMAYKLLGLEQLTAIKEAWFREGLKSRMRLFANFLHVLGKEDLDVETVEISFTRSLPKNMAELAQVVAQLSGMVPDQILLTLLPFIEDPEKAMEMLKAQKEEEAKRQAAAFGGDYLDGNDEEEERDDRL